MFNPPTASGITSIEPSAVCEVQHARGVQFMSMCMKTDLALVAQRRVTMLRIRAQGSPGS